MGTRASPWDGHGSKAGMRAGSEGWRRNWGLGWGVPQAGGTATVYAGVEARAFADVEGESGPGLAFELKR